MEWFIIGVRILFGFIGIVAGIFAFIAIVVAVISVYEIDTRTKSMEKRLRRIEKLLGGECEVKKGDKTE